MVDGEILHLQCAPSTCFRQRWTLSYEKVWLYFALGFPLGRQRHSFRVRAARSSLILGLFVDRRKNDWPQRAFFRNILRLAGVKFEVRRSSGFDPRAPVFLSAIT